METSSESLGQKEKSWIHQPQNVLCSEPFSGLGGRQEGQAAQEEPTLPREEARLRQLTPRQPACQGLRGELATLRVPLSLELVETSG